MIGIDVCKDSLNTQLVDPNTQGTVWNKTLPNSSSGVAELLQYTPQGMAWVLEPTGTYSQDVVKFAEAAGQRVLLAPTRQAKKFLESLQDRAKCDRLDSRGLALFALSRPLRDYTLKTQALEKLDQLLTARKSLSKAQASLLQGAKSLAYAKGPLKEACTAILEQIKAIDLQIQEIIKAPEFSLVQELDRVQGIGPVTAAAVGSRLTAKHFQHPDQFVAYIGLDVGVIQSGKRKGTRGLTKRGDAELRRLLYLSALASLRSKVSPFQEQYGRELAKGLSKTAAINAIARKMAKVCWAIHARGAQYDPARVYTRPANTAKTESTLDNKP